MSYKDMSYEWHNHRINVEADLGGGKRAAARMRQRHCRASAKQISKALETKLEEAERRIQDLEQERDMLHASVKALEEKNEKLTNTIGLVQQAVSSSGKPKGNDHGVLLSPRSGHGQAVTPLYAVQEPCCTQEAGPSTPQWLRMPNHLPPTSALDEMLSDLQSLGKYVTSQELYREIADFSSSAMPLLPSPLPFDINSTTLSPQSTDDTLLFKEGVEVPTMNITLGGTHAEGSAQQGPSSISSIIVPHIWMAMTTTYTPLRIAGLLIFFTLSRWQIAPSKLTFDQLPTFLRPTDKQLKIPHPRWMDLIVWPQVRDALIDNVSSLESSDEQRRFRTMMNRETRLKWRRPLGECLSATDTGQYTLSDAFKEHILSLDNWVLGPGAAEEFGFLRDIVR